MNVPDQLMTVSGCPHCFPKCEPNVKRICPVCHSPVGQTENLTARLFNKRDGKKHSTFWDVPIVGKSKIYANNIKRRKKYSHPKQ